MIETPPPWPSQKRRPQRRARLQVLMTRWELSQVRATLVSVPEGPLIVQSDKTLLLEVDHPDALACRMAIAPFAELERSPEHVHTYRLTPLGLWNARAAGHDAEGVVDALLRFSRYPVPHALLVDVAETMDRYGRLQLLNDPVHGLVLRGLTGPCWSRWRRARSSPGCSAPSVDADTDRRAPVRARPAQAGAAQAGLAGRGPRRLCRRRGAPDRPRRGRLVAARPISARRSTRSGPAAPGVVVLPCGAGKTLVGAAAMAEAKATTLILVTNTVAGRQWKRELIARTSLTEEEIGEYSGERKEIRPVTIATYQVLTTRRGGVFPHLDLFGARDWGLIVYDEVHLLPGPDLPVHRRPAGPPPARPDRDAGPRGRPRGRRVLADRPEALRRAVEGHRGAGLDRARRVRRGPRHADRRRADGVRGRRARGALPGRRDRPHEAAGGPGPGRAAQGRPDPGHRRLHRPAAPARRVPGRADRAGRDHQQGARATVRRVPRPASSRPW